MNTTDESKPGCTGWCEEPPIPHTYPCDRCAGVVEACFACDGLGHVDGSMGDEECPTCKGTGEPFDA